MLDMSAFGAHEDISQLDWQDTWINHLEIIKKTSEKDIYKYFKSHKKYISQQEDFSEEFEAYKWFDIYICCNYTNMHFKMNLQQYSAKVSRVQDQIFAVLLLSETIFFEIFCPSSFSNSAFIS